MIIRIQNSSNIGPKLTKIITNILTLEQIYIQFCLERGKLTGRGGGGYRKSRGSERVKGYLFRVGNGSESGSATLKKGSKMAMIDKP